MPTISLCMIVRDEEAVLARCLDCVADLVDEIIIVDTGSKDKTMEVAKQYTKNTYTFAWIDDFAAARNYSFSKATMEYCMWLDADDVMEESQRQLFIQMKKSLSANVDVIMMKYHVAFDAAGKPTFSYYRERIVKNDGTHLWQGAVHEAIVPGGNVWYQEIGISHKKIGQGDPDRNLQIYQKLIAEGGKLEPRHQYYYARELYYHQHYQDALQELQDFLEDDGGWVENKIEACGMCSSCYMQMGQEENALQALFKSFEFDLPRAEVSCEIGKWFFDKQKYEIAIYWYERALAADKDVRSVGFVLPDCYDYIPYLQICVCYDRIGNIEKAREYNEKAGECKPESESYLLNKEYFGKKC